MVNFKCVILLFVCFNYFQSVLEHVRMLSHLAETVHEITMLDVKVATNSSAVRIVQKISSQSVAVSKHVVDPKRKLVGIFKYNPI